MEIKRWTGPPVDTHAYLVWDEATREAWAIDAPLETWRLVDQWVRSRKLNLTRLILTHGHFDHVLDAERYQEQGIPIALHPADERLLSLEQTALFGLPYPMPKVTISQPLAEGDELTLGQDRWDVWHVPGHAPGHVILHCAAQATVLGGDLLFQGGYGRIDLPGADPVAMAHSLTRLLALPPETRVCPGHGPETTLGAEAEWLPDVITAMKYSS